MGWGGLLEERGGGDHTSSFDGVIFHVTPLIDGHMPPPTLFTQGSLERLLYIWGIRHPASGYVQGMT